MMEELEWILRQHAKRYPKIQPTDAVKLIYQNEFGGGHLISDEAACINYLCREYASVVKDSAAPLYEEIGNGIVRVNLTAVKEEKLEWLGKAFIRSAAEHKGDPDRFLTKLEVLRRLTGQGVFAFAPETLETWLTLYEAAGFPAVSHSPEYRAAYRPAYRIIRKAYAL